MTGINLGVLNTSNQSFGIKSNNFSQKKNAVYATKGEPMYQKEMDADEDGVITFKEFMDYCDENGIGYKERVLMLNNRLNYQLNKKTEESSEKVKEEAKNAEEAESAEEENSSEKLYARKGDSNYEEVIDGNDDGKITYEEYMEYCRKQSENSTEQEFLPKAEVIKTENTDTKEEQIVVKDYAKAFKSYTNSEPKAESKIEDEV